LSVFRFYRMQWSENLAGEGELFKLLLYIPTGVQQLNCGGSLPPSSTVSLCPLSWDSLLLLCREATGNHAIAEQRRRADREAIQALHQEVTTEIASLDLRRDSAREQLEALEREQTAAKAVEACVGLFACEEDGAAAFDDAGAGTDTVLPGAKVVSLLRSHGLQLPGEQEAERAVLRWVTGNPVDAPEQLFTTVDRDAFLNFLRKGAARVATVSPVDDGVERRSLEQVRTEVRETKRFLTFLAEARSIVERREEQSVREAEEGWDRLVREILLPALEWQPAGVEGKVDAGLPSVSSEPPQGRVVEAEEEGEDGSDAEAEDGASLAAEVQELMAVGGRHPAEEVHVELGLVPTAMDLAESDFYSHYLYGTEVVEKQVRPSLTPDPVAVALKTQDRIRALHNSHILPEARREFDPAAHKAKQESPRQARRLGTPPAGAVQTRADAVAGDGKEAGACQSKPNKAGSLRLAVDLTLFHRVLKLPSVSKHYDADHVYVNVRVSLRLRSLLFFCFEPVECRYLPLVFPVEAQRELLGTFRDLDKENVGIQLQVMLADMNVQDHPGVNAPCLVLGDNLLDEMQVDTMKGRDISAEIEADAEARAAAAHARTQAATHKVVRDEPEEDTEEEKRLQAMFGKKKKESSALEDLSLDGVISRDSGSMS